MVKWKQGMDLWKLFELFAIQRSRAEIGKEMQNFLKILLGSTAALLMAI